MGFQPRKTIQQRVGELEDGLRLAGSIELNTRYSTDLPTEPDVIVALDEWLELWAICEAVVVKATVDSFLNWIPLLTLNPCKISGAMVTGAPGCVTGPPPMTLQFVSSNEHLPQHVEARMFCERAAAAIAQQLDRWRLGLAPISLNWYPTFAAVAYKPAAPVPNSSCRLVSLAQAARIHVQDHLMASVLRPCLNPDWSGLYGETNLGAQVCDDIAERLSSFISDYSEIASVHDVIGDVQVGGKDSGGIDAGAVKGHTLPKTGFVTRVDRPDWHH